MLSTPPFCFYRRHTHRATRGHELRGGRRIDQVFYERFFRRRLEFTSVSYAVSQRWVTCYYFYIWDDNFGPAFVKVCAYFPYPMKIWVNGHEWAKRQALKAGLGFTELSNGFATATAPVALQAICDRLGPGAIQVFAERWWSILPLPLTERDRAAGYCWELSMRQVETSRTLVFEHPGGPACSSRP